MIPIAMEKRIDRTKSANVTACTEKNWDRGKERNGFLESTLFSRSASLGEKGKRGGEQHLSTSSRRQEKKVLHTQNSRPSSRALKEGEREKSARCPASDEEEKTHLLGNGHVVGGEGRGNPSFSGREEHPKISTFV